MLLIAAARGDKARIDSLEQDLSRTQSPSDQGRILRAARRGDRQAANDAAARIDARPFGYVVLAQTVYTCLCGAPFDLEATPNFAARLEEAGMPWPPPDTIDFPLKDW